MSLIVSSWLRYSVLQCVAVFCSVLQCSAVCCSALQCGQVCHMTHVNERIDVAKSFVVCCSVLQCVAVGCSVLHCSAVSCSVLCDTYE